MSPMLVPSSAKRIATQILLIAKSNEKKKVLEVLRVMLPVSTRNYLFEVSY